MFKIKSGKWKQIIYALLINGAVINAGMVMGWSVQVAQISTDATLPLTMYQLQWLIGAAGLSAVFSGFISGWLTEKLGPRRLMSLVLLPTIVAWIVMATVQSFAWILIGRIVHGVAFQITFATVQPLIAELVQPYHRGCLGTLVAFFNTLGIFLMFLFAALLDWKIGTLIAGVLTIPVFLSFFAIPESPYWCIRTNKSEEAVKSLRKLRTEGRDVESEYKRIKNLIIETIHYEGTYRDQVKRLKYPENLRPTILLSVLFILRELGGATIIFMYAPYFFSTAGIALSSFNATAIIGFARLLFTLIGVAITEKYGRRGLFIPSCTICGAMMFLLFASMKNPTPSATWVQMVALVIYVASFAVGFGPVPWVLMGELLPTPVRSVATSLISILLSLFYNFEALLFPEIVGKYGLSGTVFVFGMFCFLAAFIAWLYLPETKDQTLEELQTSFYTEKLNVYSKSRKGYESLKPNTTNNNNYASTSGIKDNLFQQQLV